MKKLIIIILTAISFHATSQEFAPVGAKWHYDQRTFNPDLTTYQTIESISDTIINGITCRKLMKISRMAGTLISYLYTYSVNDSVFFYAGNGFHLLYDFGAITGDTVTLGYYTTYDGSPLKMFIDSTSTIIINGETRKLQYVTCGDGMVIGFGGIVIEGLGNIGYMFPSFDPSLEGPLRCYEDSIIGLFINPYHSNNGWNFLDCEQILTGLAEPGLTAEIFIYPNPAKGEIFIANNCKMPGETTITIVNMNGEPVMQSQFKHQTPVELDVSTLAKGIYLMKIETMERIESKKLVIQ